NEGAHAMPSLLSDCLIPATACAACFATFSLAVSAFTRRRYAWAGVLLLGSLTSAAVFWRVMGGSQEAADILIVTYGGAATLVYWLRRPVARRFVIPVATTGLWTLWAAWFYLMMPFGMWEEEAKSLVSPDGRYKATLSYRDGLTFGYQHVLLERAALHGL